MSQEIERKFLVLNENYKTEAVRSLRITQGYITSSLKRSVRIRIKEDLAFLTIKGESNSSGLSRYEWEKEISAQDAVELLKLCEPGIIDKIRYEIPCGDLLFEVDEFLGLNAGLVVAEIELRHEDESFDRPVWLGEELTGDVKYYNSMLATNPYKSW
jgi:adenylate cyclase